MILNHIFLTLLVYDILIKVTRMMWITIYEDIEVVEG
jgi:hypothetical protein